MNYLMDKWNVLSGKGKLLAVAVAIIIIYVAYNFIF